MADPVYQGSGTLDYRGSSSASSLSTTITDVEVGDLLVVQVQRNNQVTITGVASTTPALTFARQARADSAYLYFQPDIYTAIATTAASSMVITASYSASDLWGSMISYRWSVGITSGTATHTASDAALRATSTSRTATNITTTARTLLLAAGTDWDYYLTHTAATNWTKILDSQTKGSNTTTIYLHARIADAGTYPNGNFATTSATDQYVGSIIALGIDVSGPESLSIPSRHRNIRHLIGR
jgi:ethanolamine utilization protein EutP (predicted NTPase)